MKFFIEWDYGFGPQNEIIEADNEDEAEEEAYQNWREGAEGEAHYIARVATEEDIRMNEAQDE